MFLTQCHILFPEKIHITWVHTENTIAPMRNQLSLASLSLHWHQSFCRGNNDFWDNNGSVEKPDWAEIVWKIQISWDFKVFVCFYSNSSFMESVGEKRAKYRKIKWAGISGLPGTSKRAAAHRAACSPRPRELHSLGIYLAMWIYLSIHSLRIPSHVNIPIKSAHAVFLNYHSKKICQPSHVMLDWGQVRGIKTDKGSEYNKKVCRFVC